MKSLVLITALSFSAFASDIDKRPPSFSYSRGKAHGFHRAELTNVSLTDILQEYSLLRETLIDYLYPMGNIVCAKIVHKYIDILCKYSMVEFVTYIGSIRTEAKEVHGESKKLDSVDKDVLVTSLKKVI